MVCVQTQVSYARGRLTLSLIREIESERLINLGNHVLTFPTVRSTKGAKIPEGR